MSMHVLKVVYEAIFEPSLLFYDKKNTIGMDIWKKEYKDWRTDALTTRFYTDDVFEESFITFNRAVCIKENAGALKKTVYQSEKFSKVALSYAKHTSQSTIVRLGMRVIAALDLELKFEELVDKLQPKFYPSAESELYKYIPYKYKDVSYATLFEEKNVSIRLQVGPVKKDELIERVQQKYPLKDKLPSNSVYLDIDCFKTKVPVAQMGDLLKTFDNISYSHLGSFSEYLAK